MSTPKRPKFSVGDIVVNTLYGTVGTVTDIQQIDGTFLYEINHGHSLFTEQTLVLLSEFTDDLWIAEEIEIELPFFSAKLSVFVIMTAICSKSSGFGRKFTATMEKDGKRRFMN